MDEREALGLTDNESASETLVDIDVLELQLLEGFPTAEGLLLIDADWLWEKFVE